MAPLVSVIIPAYNHEAYIGEAIASVLAQELADFELIVIDDGSTDATAERIQAFDDPRIRFFRQENRGAAATLNRGLELARGRYCAILNSDDCFHPKRLQVLAAKLKENPGIDLVFSLVKIINEKGESETAAWLERGLSYFRKSQDLFSAVIRDNFICTTSNLLFRRELREKTGPFFPLRYCHDLDFILQAERVGKICLCEQALLSYRVHGDNTIKEMNAEGGELFKFEVAAVIAFALSKKGLPLREAPFFLDKLLATQMGALLDLVALLLCFFNECAFDRNTFYELLRDDAASLKTELLKFIAVHDARSRRPWELYREAVNRYNEKQAVVQNLNEACCNYQKTINKLNDTLTDRQRALDDRQRALDELQWKVKNQEAILNEIYSSKGWLWLTRYRRINSRLCRWGRKIKDFLGGTLPHSGNQVVDTPDSSPGDSAFSAYRIKIIHPPRENRVRVVHAIANVMVGGSTQLVVDLYEHLGHKYDQIVATMHKPEQEAYQGLPVVDFHGLRDARQFASFLEKQRAEILHVHYWGECDDEWYKKIFQATDIYPCPIVENINIPVSAYLHSKVHKYVFVSQYITRYTENLPENFEVIYPGSHLEEFDRRGAPIPDDVIGMVYRLEPDKLNEQSIEVFIETVKRRPATRVRIVGGGSLLKTYQRRVVDEGLEQAFDFTGYVAYRELPAIYQSFSIFVAPVWRESFGQVSTFAMSMELPVVGFQVAGGVLEMIGQQECFAPDTDSLAELIVELLDDRQRRLELGRANRKRALELFSVAAMVDQYDQVYQQLLVTDRILSRSEK